MTLIQVNLTNVLATMGGPGDAPTSPALAEPSWRSDMPNATCAVNDCDSPVEYRGWCVKHLRRWERYGDPEAPLRRLKDRLSVFWTFVDKNGPVPEHRPDLGPCWVWTAGCDSNGYGVITVAKGKKDRTHRVAWQLGVGPIPDGMHVLHHCDNPPCTNYERHLFLGTHADNMRDMGDKERAGFQRHPEAAVRGEKSCNAKLTEDQVREMRRRYRPGNGAALAREFNIHQKTLMQIVNRTSWRHVD
jgi:hypothetical protein